MRIVTRSLMALVVGLMAFHATDAAAASRKLLTNKTNYPLNVVLVIRAGGDPRNQAGTVDIHLLAHHAQWVEYGDNHNIYLNGVRVFTAHDGERLGGEYIIIDRSSYLDDVLNRNNALDFEAQLISLYIVGRHVN